MPDTLSIIEASERNLKHVSLELPHKSIVVVTGPSGSGKSTLLFDVVYKEMKYAVDSIYGNKLDSKAKICRPKVKFLKGLNYPIAAKAKLFRNKQHNLADLADVWSPLVRLFLKHSGSRCPNCDFLLERLSKADIVNALQKENQRITAPVAASKKDELFKLGLTRVDVGGETTYLEDIIISDHESLEIVIEQWKDTPSKSRVLECFNIIQALNNGIIKANSKTFLTGGRCPNCFSELKILTDTLFRDYDQHAMLAEFRGCSFESALNSPLFELAKLVEANSAELESKLGFLNSIGLSYLSLSRKVTSLSSGEFLRAQLTPFLSSYSSGSSFFLDEPLGRLHVNERTKLWNVLRSLSDRGNSVFMVEHDPLAIKAADKTVRLGPVGGREGGYILESFEEKTKIEASPKKAKAAGEFTFKEINYRTLRIPTLSIPKSSLTAVCGVSGSGKSTLKEVIAEQLEQIENLNVINSLELMQKDNPNSIVATYLGIWSAIRELYAELPESKSRGLSPSDFSFNKSQYACSECTGKGVVKLNNIKLTCGICRGDRLGAGIQDLKWKGLSITELLNLTLLEVFDLFKWNKKIAAPISKSIELGFSYLRLGQSLGSLSSGEFQRMRLAKELKGNARKEKFFIFDEPSRGLSAYESGLLLETFRRLTEEGMTVVFIEHNYQLIASADHIIRLGPGSGEEGGKVIFSGPPQEYDEEFKSEQLLNYG